MANAPGKQAPPPEAENPNVVVGANAPPSDYPTSDDSDLGKLSDDDWDSLCLTHLAQARQDNTALQDAMEIVRGIRKRRNRNRNLASTDGFLLDEMDKILADEVRTRRELEEEADLRRRMRDVAGLPTGKLRQGDLFKEGAEKENPNTIDEKRVDLDGYHAGLAGDDMKVPDYVPEELAQTWMKGWERGQLRIGEAWKRRQDIEQGRQA